MKIRVLKIVEYVLVFILLLAAGFWVNKGIIIKGLYMDDLFNWSYFPGASLFEFAFKFQGASRYRPFFDALQYIEYMIVGNKVFLFVYINIVVNVLVALFIYHFVKRLNAKIIIAFLVSIMYIIAHFSYYQIGQVLGLLETEALFFALVILYLCLKLTGTIRTKSEQELFENVKTYNVGSVTIADTDIVRDEQSLEDDKKIFRIRVNVRIIICIFVMFFVIAFTHERYLCLAPVIILSIIFAKKRRHVTEAKKIEIYKIISMIVFAIEIAGICYIRQLATGKILPAGTGGTNVEETFNILQCLTFCLNQVAFIFGINIGPEYLVGIDFMSISKPMIKYLLLGSIGVIALIMVIYFISKINNKKKMGENPDFIPDLTFLLFIAMCIGASSVTIRVEMRFVYISFIASFIYLAYVCSYMFRNSKIMFIIFNILFLAVCVGRVPIELQYRINYKNIHFFLDLDRVNSLYDQTIGKYGVDEVLHNKKVYMINKEYGFTKFYAGWFYKIYDKEQKGNEIILLNDYSELPSTANANNSIVLMEDLTNYRTYVEVPILNNIVGKNELDKTFDEIDSNLNITENENIDINESQAANINESNAISDSTNINEEEISTETKSSDVVTKSEDIDINESQAANINESNAINDSTSINKEEKTSTEIKNSDEIMEQKILNESNVTNISENNLANESSTINTNNSDDKIGITL